VEIEAVFQRFLSRSILVLLVQRRAHTEISLRVPRLNLGRLIESQLRQTPALQLHVGHTQKDVTLAVPRIKLHHFLELCNAGFGIVLAKEKLLGSGHSLRGFRFGRSNGCVATRSWGFGLWRGLTHGWLSNHRQQEQRKQ